MKRLLLLLTTSLCANTLTLAHQMETAEAGDYLVTRQDRTSTLLLVRERKGDTLVLEEISTPTKSNPNWSKWIEQGAPRHTSWIAYTLNPKTGQISKTYSYSRKGWIQDSQKDQFISTLLTIKFQEIPQGKRKKVGPPPRPGSRDKRRTWNPPLNFDGCCYRNVAFNAWEATWPKDGSQLAGRRVTIYTPTEGNYPKHFPYWVEVIPAPGDNKIRVIDSGKQLTSPKSSTF